ncbi:hypothetical protein C8R46DRAFT_1029334 [Mycena filopes]|nr:hypothetical protein C8R46DRAFT_1029334 [Mycena filopes]
MTSESPSESPSPQLETWATLPKIPPFPYTFQTPRPSRAGSDADTTAFHTGLAGRDALAGTVRACVLCGEVSPLEDAHIIPQSEQGKRDWSFYKWLGFIPKPAKNSPVHEPRNGITFCKNHHRKYDNHDAFPVHKYVWFEFETFVETVYGWRTIPVSQFHGRCLRLDPDHPWAPIYSLLLIQEIKARANHPLLITPVEAGVNLEHPEEAYIPQWALPLPKVPTLQTWPAGGPLWNEDTDMDDGGNGASGTGNWEHDSGHGGGEDNHTEHHTEHRGRDGDGDHNEHGTKPGGTMTQDDGRDSQDNILTPAGLRLGDVRDVIQASYDSESWQECAREGMPSFTGTAQENTALYLKKMEMARAPTITWPSSRRTMAQRGAWVLPARCLSYPQLNVLGILPTKQHVSRAALRRTSSPIHVKNMRDLIVVDKSQALTENVPCDLVEPHGGLVLRVLHLLESLMLTDDIKAIFNGYSNITIFQVNGSPEQRAELFPSSRAREFTLWHRAPILSRFCPQPENRVRIKLESTFDSTPRLDMNSPVVPIPIIR